MKTDMLGGIGIRSRFAKHLGLKLGSGHRALAQHLDLSAVTRGYRKPPVAPRRHQRNRNAQLFCQASRAEVINKGCKLVHGSEFSKTKGRRQAQSFGSFKPGDKTYAHTRNMNQASYVPWYVKAKAKLREERHRSPDKTQSWLANELGISESSVSHYFSGRHSPNLRTIKRIAELLNLSLAELIEDDDSICQDRSELGVLRNLRALPEDKRKQLIELIENYTKGVTMAPTATTPPSHHAKPQ